MLCLIKVAIKLKFYLSDFLSVFRPKDNPEPSHLVYTTQTGVHILVKKGRKPQSPYDFRVRFREPGKRERQQAHVHSIVEMYVKQAFNPELTLKLRDHILKVFDMIQPIDYYPPRLQVFKPEDVKPFEELDKVGEFTVEFILVTTELIMIQEKTNYPQGSLTRQLYEDFGVKNRFSVIQKATFRGQRG
jgi:hypothetical protein